MPIMYGEGHLGPTPSLLNEGHLGQRPASSFGDGHHGPTPNYQVKASPRPTPDLKQSKGFKAKQSHPWPTTCSYAIAKAGLSKRHPSSTP